MADSINLNTVEGVDKAIGRARRIENRLRDLVRWYVNGDHGDGDGECPHCGAPYEDREESDGAYAIRSLCRMDADGLLVEAFPAEAREEVIEATGRGMAWRLFDVDGCDVESILRDVADTVRDEVRRLEAYRAVLTGGRAAQ